MDHEPNHDSFLGVPAETEGYAARSACWHCGTPLVACYCSYCDISWIYDPPKAKGLIL